MAKLISLALAFILSCIIVFPAASLTSPLEYLLRSDKSKPNSWIQSHPLLIPSNGTTIYAVTQAKTSETSFSPLSYPPCPIHQQVSLGLPPAYVTWSVHSLHPPNPNPSHHPSELSQEAPNWVFLPLLPHHSFSTQVPKHFLGNYKPYRVIFLLTGDSPLHVKINSTSSL